MKVTVLGISVLMMFSALLLSGDWIANDVRAVDVEPPQFEQPDHEKLTTGEEVYFYTNITDNEGIDTVKFHYSLDGGPNRELTLGGSNFTLDRWYISLVMPDTSMRISSARFFKSPC